MRRAISILLIFLLSFSLFAEPIEFEYEPYEEDEFPVWLSEIRRAESIFFGSMVLTFPLSMLAWNIMDNAGIVSADSPVEAFGWQLLMAGTLSLGISTADWVIGEVQGG